MATCFTEQEPGYEMILVLTLGPLTVWGVRCCMNSLN